MTGAEAFINVDDPVPTIQHIVLAELSGRNADNVVMVGGHLDSVQAGPGIQDNGSGSAAILEVAVQMSNEMVSIHDFYPPSEYNRIWSTA